MLRKLNANFLNSNLKLLKVGTATMKDKCHNEYGIRKSKLDYDYFLNEMSKRRTAGALRALAKQVTNMPKNIVNLGAGFPNVNTFPIEDFRITLRHGSCITIAGELANEALQYQPSSGFTKLIHVLKGLQDTVHGPQPWSERGLITCCGSQEGLSLTAGMVLNIGDPVIVQDPIYTGVIDAFKPYNPEFIIADGDQDGPIPYSLAEKLRERSGAGKPMPKILYVNPTGGNPTGVTISDDRKHQLYQLACEYNFLILEDDPYYYFSFKKEIVRSFLSMDIEGRVIRLDSFSKIISAGLRLGFITGPATLINKMEFQIQGSSIHPSSLSQVIAFKLLEEWKFDGFLRHMKEVTQFYKNKRDFMLRAAEKYLKDVAEWNVPQSGFFLWLRLKQLSDTKNLIQNKCLPNLIVMVPGNVFYVNSNDPSPYLRLCFSLASEEDVIKAISKLAVLIQEEIKRK